LALFDHRIIPDFAVEVKERSSGKPFGAKTIGQRLVKACNIPVLQWPPGKLANPTKQW
jgi:hypothetical protein